jgi:hypothetical protein
MSKKKPGLLKDLRKGKQTTASFEDAVSNAYLYWRSNLSENDVERLRSSYGIPETVTIRIPGQHEGANPLSYNRETVVYEAMFKAGLTLPLPPMIRELLAELNLAPSQIKPNGWVLLISFNVLWSIVMGRGVRPTVKEFLTFYKPGRYGDGWSF